MPAHARRLLVLLAALATVLLAGGATIAASALAAAGAQNGVWAQNQAAPEVVGLGSSESFCTRPGSTGQRPGSAAGFCVAAEEGLAPIAGGAPDFSMTISDAQFGQKLAQHARDFGLDPSNPADRATFRNIITDIGQNADEEVPGTFRGQGPGGSPGPVLFRIKGSDVVVTTPSGEFVTVLQGGINNPSVQAALQAAR